MDFSSFCRILETDELALIVNILEALGDTLFNELVIEFTEIVQGEYEFIPHGSYSTQKHYDRHSQRMVDVPENVTRNFINGEFLVQFNIKKNVNSDGRTFVTSQWTLFDDSTQTIIAKGTEARELIRALHALKRKGWI